MSKLKFKGFHATSQHNADKIIKDKFIINKNRKNEWLGYGIYLFRYFIDAKSWATKTYYCKKDPSIIECELEVEENNFLDLDNPEEMNEFQKYFNESLNIFSNYNEIQLCVSKNENIIKKEVYWKEEEIC